MSDENKNIEEEKAFAALDAEKIKAEISKDIDEKIDKAADIKAKENLSKLAKNISGEEEEGWGFDGKDKSGKEAPTSWKEGADKIKEITKEETKAEIKAELKEERDAEKAKADESAKDKKARMDQVVQEWDDDWKVLVDEEEMPSMSEENEKLVKAGKANEVDPNKDVGLKERWNLIQSARQEMEKTGKKVNLYRYFKTQYSKQPGANAPVFGGARGHVEESEDFSYEDVHNLSKQLRR